jgi:hypothetical protein
VKLTLTVSPSLKPDGGKAYSTRGQLFDGRIDGHSVVKRTATPFCTAARVLLAEGIDPATRLVMRHEGSANDALRSTGMRYVECHHITARRLIYAPQSDGYTKLFLMKPPRLDLTVEAVVVESLEWRELLGPEAVRLATKRLHACGYTPKAPV